MSSIKRFFLVSLLFSSFAHAASVTTGNLQTSYSGPGATSINASTLVTRDLSDLTGLTPGESIRVEFTQDAPVFWEGHFFYPAGELEMTWTATVEINLGGYLLSYTDTWTLGPSTVPDGGPTGVYGYRVGSDPVTRWIEVPWGTDLGEVTVTLRDLSSIDGGVFDESSMSLSGTLTTSTVPEPSVALLATLFPATLLLRRRRK